MTSQAHTGGLTAVVRAAALIVDIGEPPPSSWRNGWAPFHCGRSPGSGSTLASPSRAGGPSGMREVCYPVTVAGPRRIRTGFPSATGDTLTVALRRRYVRRAMTSGAPLGPRLVVAGTHSGVGKTTVATGLLAALRRAGHR